MPLPFGQKYVIPIIVFVLIFSAIAIFAERAATADSWTDGEEVEAYDWIGTMQLTDTHYATSWISNMDSEDITVTGLVKPTGGWPNPLPNEIRRYYYSALLEGTPIKRYPTGDSWIYPSATEPDHNSEWHHLHSWTFNIQGEVVGKLKVEMTAMITSGGGENFVQNFGWDGAYLENGRGEIYLYGDQGPFEEDEDTAQVFVRTGFTGGAGWTVKLYPPPDRTDLTTKTITQLGDDIQTIVEIPIETGWFKVGSSNEFRVELWNHLFDIGFTQIFTIDEKDWAPMKPVLEVDFEGTVATVIVTSEATYKDIDKFICWAWYGDNTMPSMSDGESWVLYGEEKDASLVSGNNFTATFTVTAKNKDGNIMIKILARDTDGRSSTPAYYQLIVEDGSYDGGGGGLSQPWLFTPMVLLLLIIGIIVSAIAGHVAPGEKNLKFAVFVFVLIIFICLAVLVAMTPGLALMLGYFSWMVMV